MGPIPTHWDVLRKREENHWWFLALRRYLYKYLKDISLTPNDILLDLGCGTGGLLRSLEKKGFNYLLGMDLSWRALSLAKNTSRVTYLLGEVSRLPIQDNSIDLVISVDLIGCVGVQPDKMLAELYRVLRSGGYALIHTPAFQWLESSHDKLVGTNRRFSRGELRNLMVESEFKILKANYHYQLLFPLVAIWKVIDRFVRAKRGHQPEFTLAPPPPILNRLLTALCWLDSHLIPSSLSAYGSSTCILAKK